MIGIYKITNKITQQSYIGQSIHIESRWKQHKNPYNWQRESTKPLYQAILKYGIDNFNFQIIEQCKPQQLNNREIFWIAQFDSYKHGYNQNYGGKGDIYNHQEIFDLWDAGYSNKEILEKTGIKSPTTILNYLQGYENYSIHESKKRGGILANKNNKQNKIYQYDLNGNFIKEWSSYNEIERILNINSCSIGKCVNGIRKTAGNFQWTNYFQQKIQPLEGQSGKTKSVAQIDLNTGDIISVYSSITQAGKTIGIDRSAVGKVCNGKRNKAAGYGWKYIN